MDFQMLVYVSSVMGLAWSKPRFVAQLQDLLGIESPIGGYDSIDGVH